MEKLRFDDLIKTVLREFPELETKYETEKDYLEGLPNLFFENILVPYIKITVASENKEDTLKKIFVLLENMLISEDEKVQEVVVVSVLEALISERTLIKKIQLYFGKNTSYCLKKLEKVYGWER